jgi:nicotinate-nucleotide pyrophosphorylase (carboxylating)
MNDIQKIIASALLEDMPNGDITTESLFKNETSTARFIAKSSGIISGILVAKETFLQVDSTVIFVVFKPDGSVVQKGEIIASVSGLTKSLLKAERVALNFLQRMSGIATMTSDFVKAIEGTHALILDTRKTTPNLRILEKQAVRDGGGTNHRMSLSDMAMLKDNHIKAAGSIASAVAIVKSKIDPAIKIEIEVESITELKEALETDADIIMLDNMSCDMMAECVKINHGKKHLEASGNMTLDRVKDVAKTGVDYISVGALTHSYDSLDVSLKFQ